MLLLDCWKQHVDVIPKIFFVFVNSMMNSTLKLFSIPPKLLVLRYFYAVSKEFLNELKTVFVNIFVAKINLLLLAVPCPLLNVDYHDLNYCSSE